MAKSAKIKVLRVVTSSECVPWHLGNTINRMANDFSVIVVGKDVSQFAQIYPNIQWIDLDIVRKMNIISDIKALYSLIRIILLIKPDIVHSIMPKAGLLAALSGFICRVPTRMHTFTGQVWANNNGFSKIILCYLDKFVNYLNTICLTDSPSQSLFLFEHSIKNIGNPLPVLSKGSLAGYDTDRIPARLSIAERRNFRKSLGINKSDFVFSFIARKTREKGAVDILKSFSNIVIKYPFAKLLFVGPDESDGELNQLKQTQPDLFYNVIEVDKVTNHEYYLAISNVLCLPSYREGFGSIVIDAAASRVPTIGSDIVGLVDSIVDGITGILFPPGDLIMLERAMVLMIEDPRFCLKLGNAAKERAIAFFTADILYESLKVFYFDKFFNRSV